MSHRPIRCVLVAVTLALSSIADAATLTFDVSGTGSVNTVSSFAADPSLPPGTTGFDALYGPYFISHFSAGSSITIETDRNGNGLARDWLLVSGTLNIDQTMPIGTLGSIVIDETITLSGGEATLSGSELDWSHYALTQFSEAGTWQCLGAGLCGLIGIPDGTTLPVATLDSFTGMTPYHPMYLGLWVLDPAHSSILADSRAVTRVGGPAVTPPLVPGQPSQWLLFGSSELGHVDDPNGGAFPFPMPQPAYPTDIPDPAEPGSGALALVAAGVFVYALRAGKPRYNDSQRSA